MNIVDHLRTSISHYDHNVILRSELSGFGGHSQLSVALKKLIDDGELVRMGRPGVFARTKKHGNVCTELLADDVEIALKEFFKKIHAEDNVVKTEWHKNEYKCYMESSFDRSLKNFKLGKYFILFLEVENNNKICWAKILEDVDKLPKKNVGGFVAALAKEYDVTSEPSKIDHWAEAISRIAGDTVHLDATGKLLTCLYKLKFINAMQMSRLMTNYMLERRKNISE